MVLITGATGGIGAATALAYARAGADVVVAGRNTDTLENVKNNIANVVGPDHVLSVQVDVVDPRAAETAVAKTVDKFGRLDIVIANAGKALEWEKCELFID